MSKIFQLRTPEVISASPEPSSFLHFTNHNLAADLYPNSDASLIDDDWDLICQFNHDPILLLDAQQRVVRANQQFLDLTGYTSSEVEGMLFSEICTFPNALFTRLSQSYQEGVLNKHVVVPFFSKSSTLIYGKVTIGKPQGFESAAYTYQITVSDVSDFVKTNKDLRKQIARMQHEEVTESMIDKSKQSNLEKIRDQMKELARSASNVIMGEKLRRMIDVLDVELEKIREKQTFLQHFEKTCPSFSIQLLAYCSSLTPAEVKHCIYVYMHLSPYEVSRILGINRKSVEMARYRIKKKLELDKADSLRSLLIELTQREEKVKQAGLQLSL